MKEQVEKKKLWIILLKTQGKSKFYTGRKGKRILSSVIARKACLFDSATKAHTTAQHFSMPVEGYQQISLKPLEYHDFVYPDEVLGSTEEKSRNHVFLISHPFGQYATSGGGKTIHLDKAIKFDSIRAASKEMDLRQWQKGGFIWIKEFMADKDRKILWHIANWDQFGGNVDPTKLESLLTKWKDADWEAIDKAVVDEMHKAAGTGPYQKKQYTWVIVTTKEPTEFYNANEGIWTDDLSKASIFESNDEALHAIKNDELKNCSTFTHASAKEFAVSTPKGYRARKPD